MNEEEMDFTDARFLRKRAEELYEVNKENISPSRLEFDLRKLLQELQIHHLELELQNEDLRLSHIKAEVALKKYTLLFDLSAMGYFLLEPDGTINELNFSGADMLHERRFTLKGANFNLFVSDESKPVFNDFINKIYINPTKESCRIKLGYNGHPSCMVYIEGIVMEEDKNCLLSVVNLSKLHDPKI